VRELAPQSWILAPGIGAQGGDLAATLTAGLTGAGRGLIVPVSRSVIYAADPRQAAIDLRDQINAARQNLTARQPALPYRDLILKLHEVGCVQFGNFTLASGKQSPIYVDLRRISASPTLLRLAARAYADLLRPLSFDHLAAVPYAALTIGTAVALETDRPLIYPRKEVKAHGTGKTVEGVCSPGDTAVVIEDLVTSGGSVLTAIEQLTAAQIGVTDVAVLIDREQGGPENLAAQGYRLHAALKLSTILDVLAAAGRISPAQVADVQAYLRQG
jgi:uridine monophosphate synthetase